MTMDRKAMAAQFEEAIGRVERCLTTWPADAWGANLWKVERSDAWIWPSAGTEPIPERTDESIQTFSTVWCVGYHTLWFLDFYATPYDETFQSPDYVRGGPEELPFPAADGAAPIPTEVVARDSLLRYLAHGRAKVARTLETVTETQLAAVAPDHHPWASTAFEQLLGVNLQHVREHGASMESALPAAT